MREEESRREGERGRRREVKHYGDKGETIESLGDQSIEK